MNAHPITVQGLGKKFRRYSSHRPTTLKEAVIFGKWRMGPIERFWVLRNVSFSVAAGDILGIIGQNGAGKSTLLRLTGGVGRPDEGWAKVRGRIGSLLDLGSGFHGDLTGRENVFVSAVIDGVSRRRVAERFDEIVEFAELGQFIDSPLRTYSTGMQMRLAFSVAVHTEPQILLIDEFLSVGDISFQKKCLDRIAGFRDEGCAVIVVSHDLEQVKKLCNKVLWLKKDAPHAFGDAEVMIGQYEAEMGEETRRRTPVAIPPAQTPSGVRLSLHENRFGSLELEMRAVHLFNRMGSPCSEIASGDPLEVQIDFFARGPIHTPMFGITISNEDNQKCCELTSRDGGFELPRVDGCGSVILRIDRLDLTPGQYHLDAGVYETNWAYAYDYHWHAYKLAVTGTGKGKSIMSPPHSWQIGPSAGNDSAFASTAAQSQTHDCLRPVRVAIRVDT